MNEARLGSPTLFASALASKLASVAQDDAPRPNDAELHRLIEVMFFASLHEEEGRRSAFSIAWQPAPVDCTAVLAMASPVLVTPQNLAKLAPATQRDATSIAVRRERHGLVAWALMQRSAASAAPLTIWALSPGVVRVDCAGVPRALFARGESWFLSGAEEVKSPARALTSTFPHWQAEADPTTEIALRAAIVTRIASRALDHGLGGMILVASADVSLPAGVRTHYPVSEGRDLLAQRYAEVTRDVPFDEQLVRLRGSRERGLDGRVYVRDAAQIAFSEAIDFVARLTSVDNAVLLDTDLNVRAFGVQVIASDAPQVQFHHVNPYSGQVHVDDLSTFKGTRHPAGVIFCMRQQREAAAIIASQDRRLSLVTKDTSGRVEVLGSYERAFGWR